MEQAKGVIIFKILPAWTKNVIVSPEISRYTTYKRIWAGAAGSLAMGEWMRTDKVIRERNQNDAEGGKKYRQKGR